MVPNWTIPNAIALGNCMILKPSELVPLSAGRIAELLREAGLPDGRVQGRARRAARRSRRSAIIPGIEAISFVGSTKVAKIVYRRGTANLKRVLALGGAKNHLIVMPDADVEMTASERRRVDVGLRGPALHGGVGDGRGRRRPITSSSGMVEHARRMVPGRDIGPVISARGEGAHRALHHRSGGRRARGAGRRPRRGRAGPRERLLPRPDDHRPRDAGHADRAGRGVRPGAGDHPAPTTSTKRSRSRTPRRTATPRRCSPRAAASRVT